MLKNIMEKCSALNIHEKRKETDEYCEIVFHTNETNQWEEIFTDLFGPAVKMKKAKPTKEDEDITEKYGGIYVGQTLFKKEDNGSTIIAMFWPWQDNTYTTLKVALVK